MSNEVAHAHSFSFPSTLCDCGMTLAEERQLRDQHGNAVDVMPGVLHGQVIITWPKVRDEYALGSAEVTLTDALTGEPIVTVIGMRLTMFWADSRPLVAELIMPRDALDPARPAGTGSAVALGPHGAPDLGTFQYLVTEMRTAK